MRRCSRYRDLARSRLSSAKRRVAGLSIVELLLSLAITAVLLTAITMALNASFYAYATAAESASTQSTSRIVMQRVLHTIRSSTLHDAYDPSDPNVGLGNPADPPVQSVGMIMETHQGKTLRIWWAVNGSYNDPDLGDLYVQMDLNTPQALLDRVRIQRTAIGGEPYVFTLASRNSSEGLLLQRATVDITAEAGADSTLALEDAQGAASDVRLVASAIPRKNLEE